MISRRTFIGVLAGGAFTSLRDAKAQQPGKVWRIGFLSGGARPPDGAPPSALRQALQELGNVDGTGIIYVGRWAECQERSASRVGGRDRGSQGRCDRDAGWAGRRGGEGSDLDYSDRHLRRRRCGGYRVDREPRPAGRKRHRDLRAGHRAQREAAGDPLKEAVPKASRIAVIWNADDRAMTLRYREIEKAGRVLGVTIRPLGVREPDDFDVAFSAMTRERPDALFLVTDALTTLNRKRIIDFAAVHRVPAMYENGLVVRDGGLMSYGVDSADSLRRAAFYVDRILKGAKPSELPVEQPSRYYLLVNLKTAKVMGLTISQPLLLRADEVIQ